jgi:hypothetical protein
MYPLLPLFALLTLILSGCSTPPSEPVAVRLPPALTAPCEPLPLLTVEIGQDLRPAVLQNRVDSERVHAECSARHRAVIQAVNPATRKPRPTRNERNRP